MSQWTQCSFIQTTPVWADAACNLDTHDGVWRQKTYRGEDEDHERKGREREELRRQVEAALVANLPTEFAEELAEELAAVAEPQQTDALLQPFGMKIDYDRLRANVRAREMLEEAERLIAREREDDEDWLLLQ